MLNLNTNWVSEAIKVLSQLQAVIKTNFQAIQTTFNNHITGTEDRHTAQNIDYSGTMLGTNVNEALDNHIGAVSGSRHNAQDISYSGTVAGNNIKAAIDNMHGEMQNLSFTGASHDPLVTGALIDEEGTDFGPEGTETYLNGRMLKWEQKQLSHLSESASLSTKGHVQLQTTVDASENKALTPKALYNFSLANMKVLKSSLSPSQSEIDSMKEGDLFVIYGNEYILDLFNNSSLDTTKFLSGVYGTGNSAVEGSSGLTIVGASGSANSSVVGRTAAFTRGSTVKTIKNRVKITSMTSGYVAGLQLGQWSDITNPIQNLGQWDASIWINVTRLTANFEPSGVCKASYINTSSATITATGTYTLNTEYDCVLELTKTHAKMTIQTTDINPTVICTTGWIDLSSISNPVPANRLCVYWGDYVNDLGVGTMVCNRYEES